MKRALIVASVGVLASTVWVVSANAQADINRNVYPGNTSERYGAQPAYAPAPAYGPSRRYARRAYRRSARQTYGAPANPGAPPAVYAGGTAFTPGSGGPPYAVTPGSYAANSAQPNEWYAGPGPMRRGNKCVEHVDINRGYGFLKDCPAPQGRAARR
jgi:hypothetical protein